MWILLEVTVVIVKLVILVVTVRQVGAVIVCFLVSDPGILGGRKFEFSQLESNV